MEQDASGAALGEAEKDIVIFPGECTFSKWVGAGGC
jgi:hypothetical protein